MPTWTSNAPRIAAVVAALGVLVPIGCTFWEGGTMPRTATRLKGAGAVAERTYVGRSSLDVQGATFGALAALAFSVESADVGARGSSTLRTIEAARPTDGRVTVEILEAGPRDVVVTVEVFPADRTLADEVQEEIARRLPRPSGAGP